MIKSFFKESNNKKILIYFFISRIIIVILTLLFLAAMNKMDIDFYLNLMDNEHYLAIANSGYSIYYQYAFFPLIPILIRILGKIGFLILNQVLVLLSAYLIYYIDKEIFKNDKNIFPVLFWLLSPITSFSFAFYTEPLFIFLTLLAYYLYKEKKSYLLLGTVIGLSVMTRSTGSMLFFSIFIAMMYNVFKKKEKFKNVVITYIPATIISCLYPIYLYVQTSNPLYFIEAQDYWYKVSSNIFTVFIDGIKYTNWNYFIFIFNYFFTLVLFIYIIYLFIKNRKNKKYYDIMLYILLTLLAITTSVKSVNDPFTSYYRYIFGMFSLYFLINRNYILLFISTLFCIFVSLLFYTGFYFY